MLDVVTSFLMPRKKPANSGQSSTGSERRGTGAQSNHPKGKVMDLDPEQRRKLRELREAKKLGQKELAKLAGVTAATISNMEGTRSKQIKRAVYLKVLRALRVPANDENAPAVISDGFADFAQDIATLDGDQLQLVRDYVKMLQRRG